jgi:3-oxoacyl-[acyl-carrier protein] reductase
VVFYGPSKSSDYFISEGDFNNFMNKGTLLKDTTALVTGASSGIGAATALALASEGANILLHYNSNAEGATNVLEQIRQQGIAATPIQADLTTREGIRSLSRYAEATQIDILINNAGSLVARTPVLDFTEELWDSVMTLNLTSAFFLSQAVLRGMKERQQGIIVNLSSVAARNGGGIGALAYSSAKAALSTMTRGLTKEFAPYGIRINAVSPGTVHTNYHETFSSPAMLEGVRSITPAGRIGTSAEIADVIVFLCGPQARFIHGQVIEVNGGFLMP